LPSEKSPPVEPLATLASATAKTRSAIEGLQARLNGDAASRSHKQVTSVSASRKRNAIEMEVEETEEELEQQLQTYFARASLPTRNVPSVANVSRAHIHEDLRSRVVEGVVHRILADWARHDQELPGSARLGNEIMERLIQRVLEQFQEMAVA
jgi:hypothetical protein